MLYILEFAQWGCATADRKADEENNSLLLKRNHARERSFRLYHKTATTA